MSAMPMKLMATIQRSVSGVNQCATSAPIQPARAWLSKVAARMPATIGQGRRKRAASSRASNWVLSPISATATVPAETSRGSNMESSGAGRIRDGREGKRRVARPGARRMPSVLPAPIEPIHAARHGVVPMNGRAKYVDARTARRSSRRATPRRRGGAL